MDRLIILVSAIFLAPLTQNIFVISACVTPTFNNTFIKLSTDQELSKYVYISGCLSRTSTFYMSPDVSTIECHHQTIPIIYGEAIADLENIATIKFSKSSINRIKENAFTKLPRLWFLQLDENQIEIIESNAFVDLPKLLFLDLSKNKLAFLEHGIFHNIPLQELSLRYNEFEAFDREWFTKSTDLYTLHLDHNRIRTIQKDTFKGFSYLNCISASYNHIKRIHKDAFSDLNYLNSLRLSYNRIKQFDEDTFKLSGIRMLWLHGNNLTYMSNTTLNNISTLSKYNLTVNVTIHTNPWQCACYNQIMEWSSVKNVAIVSDGECYNGKNPVCVLPLSDALKSDCVEDTGEDLNNLYYNTYKIHEECPDNVFWCSWDHINPRPHHRN